MSKFTRATKEKSKLRFAFHGGSGAGKTYTALKIATAMGGRIVFLDTEEGSASKYSDEFSFDVLNLRPPYHPNRLIEFLSDAAEEKYDIAIIDSMTHFWDSAGGMLELVEQEAKRNTKGNSFAAWKSIDPLYRKTVQAILQSPMHVIACIRSKMDHVQERDEKTGRTGIRKVGMAPVFRSEFSFEFDVEGSIDSEHNLIIGKTRCPELDGQLFHKAGKDVADILNRWLSTGVERKVVPVAPPSAPASNTQVAEKNPEDDFIAKEYIAIANNAATVDELVEVLKEAKTKVGHRSDLLMEFRKVYARRAAEIKAWDELQAQESISLPESDANGVA